MNTGDARDAWCEYEQVVIGGMAVGATVTSSVFRCMDPPRADSGALASQMKQVRGPGVDLVISLGAAAQDAAISFLGANTPADMATPFVAWTFQLAGGATYLLPDVLILAVPGVPWNGAPYRSPFPYWQIKIEDKGGGQPANSWMFVRAGGW